MGGTGESVRSSLLFFCPRTVVPVCGDDWVAFRWLLLRSKVCLVETIMMRMNTKIAESKAFIQRLLRIDAARTDVMFVLSKRNEGKLWDNFN